MLRNMIELYTHTHTHTSLTYIDGNTLHRVIIFMYFKITWFIQIYYLTPYSRVKVIFSFSKV